MRPKGVVDGKQVNIPVLNLWNDGVTESDSIDHLLDYGVYNKVVMLANPHE